MSMEKNHEFEKNIWETAVSYRRNPFADVFQQDQLWKPGNQAVLREAYPRQLWNLGQH